MKVPRVSVVVPVFNCESSVAEALDSIFATGQAFWVDGGITR